MFTQAKKIEKEEGVPCSSLDMSKAYDRVKWDFLKRMMHKMGFFEKRVNLVMDRFSTVTYSFKLNGEVMGNITPSKGLRQRDPLSLYLFLICVEGLSSLIHEALVSTFCSQRLMTKLLGDPQGAGDLLNCLGSVSELRREVESTLLAMWDCQKLMYVRRDWLPKNAMICKSYANFYEFIANIATKIDNEALRIFCIICWRSWFLRNTYFIRMVSQTTPRWCGGVETFIIECKASSSVKDHGLLRVIRGPHRWSVPINGFYEINWCAISNIGNYRVGIGMVIRYNTGSIMVSCCQILEANVDSHVAEIMAIFRGILFSKDCGLNPCLLESDKGVAVERVLNNNFLNASYGSILSDIAV
ncbi:hypothetical protein Ddye_029221 [Dipteronia dyeriana]|uniref:Reverse transcriptase domain-containing protein n=1 Tax=Dipteronia dyeriana TaxID=168575 RepID=A0AAD9TF43_9ROSI|nr:hypothetical protein Ddye_029221 [Dipteronia dyeriana]